MPTEISGSTGVNKIQDNTIVNADINSSAAIAGSKLVNNEYFNFKFATQNLPAATTLVTGALTEYSGVTEASNKVTITNGGIWQLNLFVCFAATGNANSRWMEHHLYRESVKIMDPRCFIINIDGSYEYTSVAGSVIVEVTAGDEIYLNAAYNQTATISDGYCSAITGRRIS